MNAKPLIRTLRGILTRQTPRPEACSQTSRHGHDFEHVGRLHAGTPLHTVVFQCTKCRQVATKDRWSNDLELQTPDILGCLTPNTDTKETD